MSGARYTDAEVDEILRRAIERQREDASKLSHDDLVAAAGEVGIDVKDVEAAIAEVKAGKPAPQATKAKAVVEDDGEDEDEDDETLLRNDTRSSRVAFFRHLVTFLIVNAFLFGMNMLTTPGYLWFLWVVLGWGIGVTLQGVGLLLPESPQARKNRLRRLHRRRDRDRKRDHARLRRSEKRHRDKERGKEFERVVKEGLGLLLTTAARKIEDAVERARIEEERRKTGGVRVQLDDDDKVRIDVRDEQEEAARRERDERDERKQR